MDTPPVQSAREDKDATILCEVKGDPEPSVSWYYNGRQIICKYDKYMEQIDLNQF
jgi:Immunoglobulin domain